MKSNLILFILLAIVEVYSVSGVFANDDYGDVTYWRNDAPTYEKDFFCQEKKTIIANFPRGRLSFSDFTNITNQTVSSCRGIAFIVALETPLGAERLERITFTYKKQTKKA